MFPVAEGKWALSLGWGAWDRFHGGVQAHIRELPTPAGVALLGCLGLFVTIFVSPVQQRQWWGEGEEDWAQWESQREIGMEGILLNPSQGSYRHVDSSRQE